MKILRHPAVYLWILLFSWHMSAFAAENIEEDMRLCLMEALQSAEDSDTVGMLRENVR